MITGRDLIDAGWLPGPDIGRALEEARAQVAKGVTDKAYLLKLLRKRFPPPPSKITTRPEPVPFGEAIEATCETDEKNIAAVRRQMHDLLRVPVISRGAVMPDACPAGSAPATIPVGGAIAVEGSIIPNAHSADICCSMFATFFESEKPVGEMLDSLMASTRFGYGGRKPDQLVHHPVVDEPVFENRFLKGLENHARIHMADQGDGNHFAYIGKLRMPESGSDALQNAGHGDTFAPVRDRECLALVTHHGSRGLGAHVYKRGQNAALKHTHKVATGIPNSAAWLEFDSPEGRDYWDALQYVSRWTKANHQSIHRRFLDALGEDTNFLTDFGNEHNFVWKRGDTFLHGKGATPAWKDDQGRPLPGLIPLNMASPILLVLGRDNDDYLSFCPHGAGRNLSRTATMRRFKSKDGTVDEAQVAREIAAATEGLDIRWFYGKGDFSESPAAYKPADQVKAQIEQFGLADIVAEIEPLGSIMAGDSGPAPWMRRKDILSPKQIRQIEHRATRRKTRQSLRDEIY